MDAREELDRLYLQTISMADAAQAFELKLRGDGSLKFNERTALLREIETLRGDIARIKRTIHEALASRR